MSLISNMRVLHASVMTEPALGVLRQLESEQTSAEQMNLNWSAKLFCDGSISSPVVVKAEEHPDSRLAFKLEFYKWLRKEIKDFDVLLLRYSFHDPFQFIFLCMAPIPVVLVHHTLEGPELRLVEGKAAKIKHLAELVLGPLSLSVASGIVAVTEEILRYEESRRLRRNVVSSHVYPNGIMYSSVQNTVVDGNEEAVRNEVECSTSNGDSGHTSYTEKIPVNTPPSLLFVSSVYAPWQGLEELIESASRSDRAFECNIVGDLTEVQLSLLETDDRFVVHGRQNSAFIKGQILDADIGLSALALSKKNMTNACTLKVREYMMSGLCTYAGYQDVFPEGFPYFKSGEIDIDAICDYAIQSRQYSPELVSNSARCYIDKPGLVNNLYLFLKNL